MKISIQEADTQHLQYLAEIERSAASGFDPEDLPIHLWDETVPLRVHEEAQRKGLLLVALGEGGRPVGYALTSLVDRALHLAQMDVHPDHQQRGIGSRMLEEVVRLAQELQCEAVMLTTFRHIPWNGPWYQRFGFTICDGDGTPLFLEEILEKEAAMGLDPAQRVAMIRAL
jgi:GNAT superfamily N-acetyltransferase